MYLAQQKEDNLASNTIALVQGNRFPVSPNPWCSPCRILRWTIAWSMFTAAATLDNDVRDKLVSGVYARATFNGSPTVFPTGYSPQDGTTLFGQAR